MKLRLVLFAIALIFGLQTNWAATEPAVQNGIEPIVANDYTSSPVTAADADYTKVVKKEKKGLGKILTWVKEKVTKVVKKFAQLGGLGDPVDKWFWFWILGWAAGLVLYIVAIAIGIGTLGSGIGVTVILLWIAYLAWLFGAVSLVVWLIKKFS